MGGSETSVLYVVADCQARKALYHKRQGAWVMHRWRTRVVQATPCKRQGANESTLEPKECDDPACWKRKNEPAGVPKKGWRSQPTPQALRCHWAGTPAQGNNSLGQPYTR